MQFEAPHLLSIHSYYKTETDTIVTPEHSLVTLEPGKRNLTAISASWSFDPNFNVIIGIREVYTKLGRGGSVEVGKEIIPNDVYQKIINWKYEDSGSKIHFT